MSHLELEMQAKKDDLDVIVYLSNANYMMKSKYLI